MKTLEAHNTETANIATEVQPVGNGIACPECGGELVDTSPNKALLKDSPKKGVKCEACSYSGYRNAAVTVEPNSNGDDKVVYS